VTIIKNMTSTKELRLKGICYIAYLVVYYNLGDPKVRSLWILL
jgi:hypothetical protein